MLRLFRRAVLSSLALSLAAPLALAGPPAVCHPIATAAEVAVPWRGEGWNTVARDVTPEVAARKALDALEKSDDVFAHMEAIRRAVVYLSGHGKGLGRRKCTGPAEELVTRLRAEVAALVDDGPEKSAEHQRLALRRFDLAYTAAALDQVGIDVDVDVRALFTQALEARPEDARMRLGAALGLWTGPSREREAYRHLAFAIAAAERDAWLEKNLLGAAAPLLGKHSLADLRREVHRKLGRS